MRTDTAADVLSIDMPISGGANGITKSGLGTLILSTASVSTGGTTAINEGIVRLTGAGTLNGGVNAALRLRQGATLDLSNAGGVSVGQFNGAGTVTSTVAGSRVFSFGNGNGTANFSGTINNGAGTTAVTKAGTATATLGGSNSYTGQTIIQNGILNVATLADGGSPSSIGSSSNAASNLILGNSANSTLNATLAYVGASAVIIQGTTTPSVSTDRLFTLDGNAAIDSSGGFGSLNNLAAASANNAALIFSNSGPVAYSSAGVKNLTLQGTSTADNQINLQLVDNTGGAALSLAKAGASVWILGNAANTYTGTTLISGGVLRANDGASLPTASPLVIAGGQFESSGTFTRSLGSGAGLVRFGAGNSGFSANPSNLSVNIGGGGATLTWASPDFLPAGNLVLGSATSVGMVDIVNGIDLNSAATTAPRVITITDNTSTSTDVARISGVISGGPLNGGNTSGVALTLPSNLQLFGANSYQGSTALGGGTVIVNSIGGFAGTSSLGDSSNVVLTNAGTINYVGAGETSFRSINLNAFTGGVALDANGTAPLIWKGIITDTGTTGSTKVVTLQGTSQDANDFDTSTLVQPTTGGLTVNKAGSGVWIVTGVNSAGSITGSSGTLGLGNEAALGSLNAFILGNVNLFAAYGDRTITNAITLNTGTNTAIICENNVTFNGLVSYGSAGNNTLTNNLVPGKAFTVNGFVQSTDTAATRTISFNGSGLTVLNGQILNGTVPGTGLHAANYNGTGTMIVNGGAQPFSGGFTEAAIPVTGGATGTLIVTDKQSIGTGTFTFTSGNFQSTIPLTGANSIPNRVLLNGTSIFTGGNSIEISGSTVNNGGNRNLVNNMTGGATLTLSGPVALSDAAATTRNLTALGTGTTNITGIISNGSTAPSNFTKAGTGVVVLTASNAYTGATSVQGGILRVASGGSINPAVTSTTTTVLAAGTLDVQAGGFVGGTVTGAGTVMGDGVIQTLTFTGSTLSPGAGPNVAGTLSVNNGLTLSSATHFKLDIAGPSNAIGTYDRVVVGAGSISLNGDFAGSAPVFGGSLGDVFGIILNNGAGTTTGIINGIANAGLINIGSQSFNIYYGGDFNTGNPNGSLLSGGNDVLLVAVPEPSVIGYMLSGFVGLLGLQRFRRRRNA